MEQLRTAASEDEENIHQLYSTFSLLFTEVHNLHSPHTQQREEPRARGASHHLALMGKCHTLHPHVFAQSIIAQKMKFSIFSKLRIWSHLLKKSLMENFIFCAVHPVNGILLVNSLLCVGH